MVEIASQKGAASHTLKEKDKVLSLYRFILELNKLNQNIVTNVEEYQWRLPLSCIPDDPNHIEVHYLDSLGQTEDDTGTSGDDVLMSVKKPVIPPCPEPEEFLKSWLLPGWDQYQKEAAFEETKREFVETTDGHGEERLVHFADDPKRVRAFKTWTAVRQGWIPKRKLAEETSQLFTTLYMYYFELKKNGESKELVVGNGMLREKENEKICHPILTHRVQLDFDAAHNMVFIKNTDAPTELYTALFQNIKDINREQVNVISSALAQNDYHPLDRANTPGFLKESIRNLSSAGQYYKEETPKKWNEGDRFALSWSPCYFVRSRLNGTLKAVQEIIENIQTTGEIPAPLIDLVSGGKVDVHEEGQKKSVSEALAEVGGESKDIFLSLPANKEQLEIAKRIEQYNAVLVQGPPGTGKTHTIANLMGHFLAQGKSILVTSYTSKALSVLKNKVVKELQDMCVSVLDDSKKEMERSVDGITDALSRMSVSELKQSMEELEEERMHVIHELAGVRQTMYDMIYSECHTIIYQGQEMTPSEAAAFVLTNEKTLSYIPGKVEKAEALPLTHEELNRLYRSNGTLSSRDEEELARNLPDPQRIMDPDVFEQVMGNLELAQSQMEAIKRKFQWSVDIQKEKKQIIFHLPKGQFTVTDPDVKIVKALKDHLPEQREWTTWEKQVVVDGKAGGAYRQRWLDLKEKVSHSKEICEQVILHGQGKNVTFGEEADFSALEQVIEKIKTILDDSGKVSWLKRKLNPAIGRVMDNVRINGKELQCVEDCELVMDYIHMHEERMVCSEAWNSLMVSLGVPAFYDLGGEPEREAEKYMKQAVLNLDWYEKDYAVIKKQMEILGIPSAVVFQENPVDSDIVALEKVFRGIIHILPSLCEVIVHAKNEEACLQSLEELRWVLSQKMLGASVICGQLAEAVSQRDTQAYRNSFSKLTNMYAKYALQKDRQELLEKLAAKAPDWAEAVRQRSGIHGSVTVPETIDDAWKWKQLSRLIQDMTAHSFQEYQQKSMKLSCRYREATADYAVKSGWYHLLMRVQSDISMEQDLQGWKQTVQRIGKGTGKNAPRLRAKAKALMARCQRAVPAWIMPISRALETLNPKVNHFDVVIIDEASQADISALAILYMGKKLIIVGDNKQVSPVSIGKEDVRIQELQNMYITGKVPNAHLYDPKASLYDVAETTFHPLMLKEHFRCVPEIIGFSNMLSYDFKIKPLRAASSSNLLPAVVNYRVAHGMRDGKNKINWQEARTIVALLKACIHEPEYKKKTFGVISLLGNEQAELIQRMVTEQIDASVVEERQILCGNSANFQGDERDVIFLSVVDSPNGKGPLRKVGEGADDVYKKRYNVAASRARDQLWVVDSLDSDTDLKPGDIRKRLIDYSKDPQSFLQGHEEIQEKAESPFEEAVATALVAKGYHLEQQWEVGAYRIDMVAFSGDNAIAIECDGERWHSSPSQIQNDLERQTILERLGWRFIRIRGSEYYRNPDSTIARVVADLEQYDIHPEAMDKVVTKDRNTELLQRVKQEAVQILSKEKAGNGPAIETIGAALHPEEIWPLAINNDHMEPFFVTQFPKAEGKNEKETGKELKNADIKTQQEQGHTKHPIGEPTLFAQETPQKKTGRKRKTTKGKRSKKDNVVFHVVMHKENTKE